MKSAPSLITGQESVEILRGKIRDATLRCPLNKDHPRCPIRMFGLLGEAGRNSLINQMTRESCLTLFELERLCRESAECQRQ